MSNQSLPTLIVGNNQSQDPAIETDLREVLSELSAKYHDSLDGLREGVLMISQGILNPSPEHFDFLLEGLDEFDLVIQPSLSGKILALAANLESDSAKVSAELWAKNEDISLLDLAKAAHSSGCEHCVQPPWYGLIDGKIGCDFAYQHMSALALSPDSEPLAIRTLEWLRKGQDA